MKKMLSKMATKGEIVVRTHDFHVGRPSPAKVQRRLLLKGQEKEKYEAKLTARCQLTCPLGPYSACVKGSG